MELLPIALLGALVYKFVDFGKFVVNGRWNAAGTQVVVWVGGVAAVLLTAQTDFAGAVAIGEISLADANGWTRVLFGLEATSLLSAFYDAKKAVDGSDSAATPPLLSSWTAR